MRIRRTPFYGEAVDRELLGMELVGSMGDGSFVEVPVIINGAEASSRREPHPNYREIGADVPLGFIPHQGENRRTRRKAVAKWVPPKQELPKNGVGGETSPPTPAMPTRRELLKQRQRKRRGKLDPELRRLQREKARTK